MLRGMGGCQNVGMSIHKLSLPFEKLFIVPEQPHPGKHAHHAYYSRRSADKGNKRRNDHSGYSIPHWRGIVAPAVAFTTKKKMRRSSAWMHQPKCGCSSMNAINTMAARVISTSLRSPSAKTHWPSRRNATNPAISSMCLDPTKCIKPKVNQMRIMLVLVLLYTMVQMSSSWMMESTSESPSHRLMQRAW